MGRATATTTSSLSATTVHERVDPSVYEGWDFAQLNREAAELRAIAREQGRDAAVSRASGHATTVARRSA